MVRLHPRSARLLTILAVLASLLTVTRGARAQTIVNPSFESGPVVTPSQPIVPVLSGSDALTGWTVVSGSVNVIEQGYWAPWSGARSLMLSGASGPGAIEQTIATLPGQRYALGFGISGDPLSPPVIKHLRVSAAATQQDVTFDSSPAWHWDMAWSARTLEFTATGPTTTIRFASLDPEPWGPAIDSVTVTVVGDPPAPVTPLALEPLRPDPVVDGATLSFALPRPGRARVSLYDLRGRLLSRLFDADTPAGVTSVVLPGDAFGREPGVRFLVLDTPDGRRVRRCTRLR